MKYLLKTIRTLSITVRMISLVLIFCGALIVLFLISAWASSMRTDAGNRAQQFAANKTTAQIIESNGLKLRQAEKNFFITRDLFFTTNYSEAYIEATDRISELGKLLSGQEQAVAEDLGSVFAEHRQTFTGVKDRMMRLGLTADIGLEGSLRKSVHEIEEILKTYDDKDLTILMLQMRRHEKDFIARLDKKYIDRIALRRAEFIDRLSITSYSPAVKDQITALLEAYVGSFNEYSAERLALVGDTELLETIFTRTLSLTGELVAAMSDSYEKALTELDEVNSFASTASLYVTILFLLLSLVLASAIVYSIVAPMRLLDSAVTYIAKGDYDVDVPGTDFNDEIGSVSQAIDRLKRGANERQELEREAAEAKIEKARLEKQEMERQAELEREKQAEELRQSKEREQRSKALQEMITQFEAIISDSLVQLSDASTVMTKDADGMFGVAKSTGDSVAQVTDAATQMEQSIASNSTAVSQFTSSIAEVNSQVRNASKMCDDAVQMAKDGEQSINAMSKSAAQVNGVIAIINEIAEQTNLLALNATIEAARAGEMGRGFAVVASEVKSLANQTAQATDKVTEEIKSMQSSVLSTVEKMQSIIEIVEQLTANMNGIAAATEEQETTTREIARATDISSHSASRVTTEISDVSTSASKVRDISSSVKEAAEKLAALGGEMSSEINSFLQRVNA